MIHLEVKVKVVFKSKWETTMQGLYLDASYWNSLKLWLNFKIGQKKEESFLFLFCSWILHNQWVEEF